MDFVVQAIEFDSEISNQLMIEMQQITNLENPNSI